MRDEVPVSSRGHMKQKHLCLIIALAFKAGLLAGCPAASARDLSVLVEFVTPTYTGTSLAALCGNVDKTFLTRTSGPRGTIVHYAEHAKDEAIAGLAYDDSVLVLKDAAGKARDTARRKLYELAVPSDDMATSIAVHRWCGGPGEDVVRGIMTDHDRDHDAKAELLRRAKTAN